MRLVVSAPASAHYAPMASIFRNRDKWRVIIRRKGHKPSSKTFPKKALAERWARQEEERIASLVVSPEAEKTTVRALLTKYAENFTPRKRSSNRELSRIGILSAALGDLSLAKLRAEDVIDFVDERLETVSSDTIRKELNTLSIAIDAGMALWNISLPANPVTTAKGVLRVTKTLTPGVKRDRRPTAQELALLRDTLPGIMPLLVDFAIETAMRRGEIVNIKRAHEIDGILSIPETKTDKPRKIPLTLRAAEILEKVGYEWGMTANAVSKAFNRTCRACGIHDLRFHDLRREATSRFFELGLTIPEVAAITGHQTWSMLKRYTDLDIQDVRKRLMPPPPAPQET